MNKLLEERRERQRKSQAQRPVGLLAAMFTGSVVTLIGVFSGVDPFVVLIRAVVSAALMAVLVSIGTMVIRSTTEKPVES